MAQTKTAVVQTRLDAELARRLLTQMAMIRRFEEKAAEMYALGKIGGSSTFISGRRRSRWAPPRRCAWTTTRCRPIVSTATAWPRDPIRAA